MKTHIIFVLDRSSSMSVRKQETISGFNEYLADIQADDNLKNAHFTLVTFNTTFETVFANEPLKDIEGLNALNYIPNGMTALYDAVAHALSITQDAVKKKHRALVVILTDGEENSSKEYTRDRVFNLISDFESKGNYTFVFLGCDQDVWGAAGAIGVSVRNTMNYDPKNIHMAFAAMSVNTRSYAESNESSVEDFFDKLTKTMLY